MSEIRHFMTQSPHAVGCDQSLRFAHDRMQQYGIRHVPVLEGGVLVGVLSERDVALIGAITPSQLDTIVVEEAMAAEPYTVAASDHVVAVTSYMAEHKYDNAVVMDHNKVVGMFTTTDALQLLSAVLKEVERASDLKQVLARLTEGGAVANK